MEQKQAKNDKPKGDIKKRKMTQSKTTPKERVHQLFTKGLKICCSDFSKITQFLDLILMELIDMKNSSDSKLQVYFTCSIRISSRK